MSWASLANNQTVSWDNLTGSGIVAKVGQTLLTGQRSIIRSQANSILSVQPVTNDNKCVLKNELIAISPIIYYEVITVSGMAYSPLSFEGSCGVDLDSTLKLYTTNSNGIIGLGETPYKNSAGNYVTDEGFYSYVTPGNTIRRVIRIAVQTVSYPTVTAISVC